MKVIQAIRRICKSARRSRERHRKREREIERERERAEALCVHKAGGFVRKEEENLQITKSWGWPSWRACKQESSQGQNRSL